MGHGPCLARLSRRVELVEEADEVDLRDDLDLLLIGGLTDIDWLLRSGEDTGDINGVEAGETIVGVITGDI